MDEKPTESKVPAALFTDVYLRWPAVNRSEHPLVGYRAERGYLFYRRYGRV